MANATFNVTNKPVEVNTITNKVEVSVNKQETNVNVIAKPVVITNKNNPVTVSGKLNTVTTIQNNKPVVVSGKGVQGEPGKDIISVWTANTAYPANTVVQYNNKLYSTKITFTSGTEFDADNWNQLEAGTIISAGGNTGTITAIFNFEANDGSIWAFQVSRPDGNPTLTAQLLLNNNVVSSVSKSVFDSFTLTANKLRLTAGTTNSTQFPFESLTNIISGAGTIGEVDGNTVDITLISFTQGITYSATADVKIENKTASTLTRTSVASVNRFIPQFKGITSTAPTTFTDLQALTQTGAWNGSVTTQTGDFAFTTPTLFTKAIIDGVTETFFSTPTTITQNDYNGNPVTMYSYFLDDTVTATLTNFS